MNSREISKHWPFFLLHSVIGTEIASGERLFEIFCCVFDLENSHLNEKECYEIFCKQQIEKYTEEVYREKKQIAYSTFHDEVEKIINYLDKKVDSHSGKIDFIKGANKNDEDKKDKRRSRPLSQVWKWLKEGYPEWLKSQGKWDFFTTGELWEKLRDLGLYDRQKLDLEIEPSRIDGDAQQIKLKIIAEAGSKIVILNRDKEGSEGIFCVYPSELAPEFNLENQQLTIFQKISNNSENQYWLWCVFSKVDQEAKIDLGLSWINESLKFKNFELSSSHLWELLIQVELQSAKVFYADKNIKKSNAVTNTSKIIESSHSCLKDPLFKAAISFLLQEYSDIETIKKLNNWISISFWDEPKIILDCPEDIEDLINRFIYLGIFKNPEKAKEFFFATYDRDSHSEIAAKKGL